jgi:hypothetical protein
VRVVVSGVEPCGQPSCLTTGGAIAVLDDAVSELKVGLRGKGNLHGRSSNGGYNGKSRGIGKHHGYTTRYRDIHGRIPGLL